jgi:ribosome biogenesis GTPase / thiamine phosphate phosphatase
MSSITEKQTPPERLGLVVSYFGSSVAVEGEDGQVFQCHLRRNQALPVVGDRVAWQLEKGETGTVKLILPRRSLLSRGDGRGNMKPIAANIDVIAIVMAPPPIFSDYLIDRYLVAAELLNIKPIIIVNKADLLNETTREQTLRCLAPYKNIPYPVVLTSVVSQEGLVELAAYLKNEVAVLVGPSGVGKSSIISVLNEQVSIEIGEVTPKGAGKHTTTSTRFYHLPQGGALIDSPGVREFNLWPVTKAEVLKGFKEFAGALSGCRFRDCQHTVEPGCAVQLAVGDARISPQRFANYLALMKEAARGK